MKKPNFFSRDDVQWTEEQENLAKEIILLNSTVRLPDDSQGFFKLLLIFNV